MTTRPAAALTAVLAAGVLLLTGCSDGLGPGPAGTVVAKDKDTRTIYHPGVGKTPGWTQFITQYYLVTKDPADGSTTRFEVSEDDYDDCRRGSSYPRCTER